MKKQANPGPPKGMKRPPPPPAPPKVSASNSTDLLYCGVDMNKEIVKRDAVRMAASLAKGDVLSVLLGRCEQQKTVSTRIVERDLEVVQEFMRQCAVQIRKLHDLL